MTPTLMIVGCGGVGSWLVQALKYTAARQNLRYLLLDGDLVEKRNLERQLFRIEDIGVNKAEALQKTLGARAIALPAYFDLSRQEDVIGVVCCVDNRAARRDSIAWVDCRTPTDGDGDRPFLIVAANEREDAEAYIYLPRWRGDARLDPRLYFPNAFEPGRTDRDPRRAGMGCAQTADIDREQTALANIQAAVLALKLLELWIFNRDPNLRDEDLYYYYGCNAFRFQHRKPGDSQ